MIGRWCNTKVSTSSRCAYSTSLQPAIFTHHVQVFVANPNKSDEVVRILTQNRDRLLKFLPTFLDDRTEDDQFNDEKAFIIRQIELLPAGA